MIEWGVKNFILLNAAGSTSESYPPGTLMALADHLNMGLPNPLTGPNTPTGQITFVDLVDLYDPTWRAALTATCTDVKTGIYAGMLGPSYETPAEVAMVAQLGGHAVGMSTIPEAIAAKAAGARVLAISMMTNLAAGVGGSRPNHQEVLDTAAEHGKRASEVLKCAVLAAAAE
jgi:purine-nucleoside phosphorylase